MVVGLLAVALPLTAPTAQTAAPKTGGPACSNDTGITLPPCFCATDFAYSLVHPRQMVVAPDGVLYVNTWCGTYY